MDKLYEFLVGPALWAAFTLFVLGLVVRLAYFCGALSKERSGFLHSCADLKWVFGSIIGKLVAIKNVMSGSQPLWGIILFLFHACLLGVPLFLLAHNMLWEEAYSMSLPSLPDSVCDLLTVVFIAANAVLLAARIVRTELRRISTTWDYSLHFLTGVPFVAGFLAYHQIGPYRLILILHIIFAEILLIIIPFSKPGHAIHTIVTGKLKQLQSSY
ncbi:putative Protein DVU_0532 [Syntrophobacter sp. SbD1]|nr:putative Protein DVU_0532 [Syntrophobacter sp. SbD1]